MREIARRSDETVSHSSISEVLQGKTPPSEKFCVGVAKGLGLPPEFVLRKAGHLPPAPGDTNSLTLREIWLALQQMSEEQLREVRRYARYVRETTDGG